MSFLQRPPIDVTANVGCASRLEWVHETAERLLAASQTRRPYAGAVVRNAVGSQELADLQEGYENEDNEGIVAASFLEPLNQAISDWWPTHPYHDQARPTSIEFERYVKSGTTLWHTDQVVNIRERRPAVGPLTALVVLFGSVRYGLSVNRVDMFDSRHQDPWLITGIDTRSKLSQIKEHPVDAGAGDVVLFTNLPPTYHEAKAQEPNSVRGVYIGGLRKQAVQ